MDSASSGIRDLWRGVLVLVEAAARVIVVASEYNNVERADAEATLSEMLSALRLPGACSSLLRSARKSRQSISLKSRLLSASFAVI